MLILLNLNPVPKRNWELTVKKEYKNEIFNSDSKEFWGTGDYMNETVECFLEQEEPDDMEDQKHYKLTVNLPPLAGVVLK